MLYYGNKLSENISRREPEGYLICKDVAVARAGPQVYLANELGMDGGDKEITVERTEDEVFDKATVASFEGMPVTDDHPEDEVNAENISIYQKGHCQNVHRGTGDEAKMLKADLIITDPGLIEKIMQGKREISCGYNYELSEENGKFMQRQIRGNHIAVVDKGRAGHRVCIKDSKPIIERGVKKMSRKGLLGRMFASFARDEEIKPEELAEAADEIQEILAKPEKEPVEPQNQVEEAVHEPSGLLNESERLNRLEKKLDELTRLVKGEATDEEPEEAEEAAKEAETVKEPEEAKTPENNAEDPFRKLEDDLSELEKEFGNAGTAGKTDETEHFVEPEKLNEADEMPPEGEYFGRPAKVDDEQPDEEEGEVIESEEEDEPEEEDEEAEDDDEEVEPGEALKPMGDKKRGCDMKALRLAIDALKPVIATLPAEQRKKASDAAIRVLRKNSGMDAVPKKNGYAAIKKSRAAKDAKKQSDGISGLAERIMKSRNANFKK